MKKYLLMVLTVLMGATFAACDSDDDDFDPSDAKYPLKIDGVWTDLIMQSDVERIFCFSDSDKSVTLYSMMYSDYVYKEKVNVPYTYNWKNGNLVMDFSGINNVGDIKKISFEVLDNEYMFGILEHGNPATPNDTLLTNYFCDYYSFGTAADADPYGADYGPNDPADEMPALTWNNPFDKTSPSYKPQTRSVVATTILAWAGSHLLEAAGLKVSNVIVAELWNQFFPEDETTANIKQIMADVKDIKKQLDVMNAKIDELIAMHHMSENLKVLTDRNDRYNDLAVSVQTTMQRIESAIQDKEKYGIDDSIAISTAILEWGNGQYHNNSRYDAAKVYVDKALQSPNMYPDLYDIFAYETNDWESDGYQWRQMLQTNDLALVGVAAELAAMYWIVRSQAVPNVITPSICENNIRDLQNTVERMEEYYTQKAVVVNYNQMICQISGLHMVFNKKIEWRDLQHPSWYAKGRVLYPIELLYGDAEGKLGMERFLTEAEFLKLNNYYSEFKGSLLALLKHIGFDIATSDNTDSWNAKMVLPGDAVMLPVIKFDQNDDLYFGKVINNSTRKKEVMVKVGEIWAPRNGGWWNFTAQKTFDHYVSYENNTWFNMRVLAR